MQIKLASARGLGMGKWRVSLEDTPTQIRIRGGFRVACERWEFGGVEGLK